MIVANFQIVSKARRSFIRVENGSDPIILVASGDDAKLVPGCAAHEVCVNAPVKCHKTATVSNRRGEKVSIGNLPVPQQSAPFHQIARQQAEVM